MDGNNRFVEGRVTFYKEDLAILRQNTAEKQKPFASVISCTDSRVSVEIMFDHRYERPERRRKTTTVLPRIA